ncbi:TolC family protein [Pseudomonas sp. M30-35]|uniref:TolC family protein n=1 Tax=Pseudomonas sp. M30-35 TaxID=1981174 RepID=UPI000B3C932A|nr:TolC family protein [Pseudomonas sp. M30-35]ARU86672.1 transporter [Pseudomonas sp. M30-35]
MTRAKLLITIGAVTVLSACSVTPEKLTSADLETNAERNLRLVDAEQDPITGSIDLNQAVARALKYNLDYKVELMEHALRARELDLSRYDMLPQLVSSVGYAGRNNYSGSSSRSLISGQESLEPSTSAEKDIFSADLTLSWDVLDFGLSYVRAQQKADQVLIAMERRRKVANRIIEEVRIAYWRSVSAERLMAKLHQLESSVQETLTNGQRLSERRLSSPLTALTYQRELIDIQSNVRQLQRELVVAKAQLSALMNVRPGTKYSLVLPDRGAEIPKVHYSGEEMMMTALQHRSELREVSYLQRINAKELDVAMLSALPNFKTFIGVNYDTNDFLYNNNWLQYGASASWNVLNLFRLPAHKRTVKAEEALLQQRELALAMAVMTQVYVSRAQLAHRRGELDSASRKYKVQSLILDQIKGGYGAGAMSKQTLLREEMNTLVTEVKYDIAYAEAQGAYANLFSSMGIDSFGSYLTGERNVVTLSHSNGL